MRWPSGGLVNFSKRVCYTFTPVNWQARMKGTAGGDIFMAGGFFRRLKEDLDTGFSRDRSLQGTRLLNQTGEFNIKRTGLPFWETLHLYHELTTMPWWKFVGIIFVVYFILNMFFASLYMLVGFEHLTGYMTSMNQFQEAFFFSAETITTVGYGRVNPVGLAANIIAAVESLLGLMGFALATGLMYGRFSKATAKLIYSQNVLISPYKESETAVMFRLANKKKSLMVEPEVEVIAVIEDENGATRFYNLELERKRVTYLTLSWTVVHPINAHSPFNGLTIEDIRKLDIELLITVKAFDTTFGSTVYSHYSYKSDEFIWGAKFVKIFHPIEGSDATRIELDKLNAYQPAEIKVLASEIS